MPTYRFTEYGRYEAYGTFEADNDEEAEEILHTLSWDDVEYEPFDWDYEEYER